MIIFPMLSYISKFSHIFKTFSEVTVTFPENG